MLLIWRYVYPPAICTYYFKRPCSPCEHVLVIYSSLRFTRGFFCMPVNAKFHGVGNFMHVRLLRPACNQSRLYRKTMAPKLASISQYKCVRILNSPIYARGISMKRISRLNRRRIFSTMKRQERNRFYKRRDIE